MKDQGYHQRNFYIPISSSNHFNILSINQAIVSSKITNLSLESRIRIIVCLLSRSDPSLPSLMHSSALFLCIVLTISHGHSWKYPTQREPSCREYPLILSGKWKKEINRKKKFNKMVTKQLLLRLKIKINMG